MKKLLTLLLVGISLTACTGEMAEDTGSISILSTKPSLAFEESCELNILPSGLGAILDIKWSIEVGEGSLSSETGLSTTITAGKKDGDLIVSVNVIGSEKSISESITLSVTKPDTDPPAAPEGLSSSPSDDTLSIQWNPGSEEDIKEYKLLYSTVSGSYPSATDNVINVGNETSYTFENLTNGVTYYFQVVAIDNSNNMSIPSQEISATPYDTGAPGPGLAFASTQNAVGIKLTWINPGNSDLEGVRILRSGTSYPVSENENVAEGITLVYEGMDESFIDTSVVVGKFYYYTLFAFDEIPNFSEPSNTVIIYQEN